LLILLGSFVNWRESGKMDGIFRRFARRFDAPAPCLIANGTQGTAILPAEHSPDPYIRLSKHGAVH
ncbi:hypothetical protein, partial [Agrobacterium genomosp. 13]|uniref:hypothetical protein n=1 Tax=Agrobacterium genomosp. 13 TaxID=1183419 RepID=UPI001ABF8A21